jgi:hypothetical protein
VPGTTALVVGDLELQRATIEEALAHTVGLLESKWGVLLRPNVSLVLGNTVRCH